MKFALSLDDRSYPDDGMAACGPQKLLAFLEKHCGLTRATDNSHLRAEQYRQRLARHLAMHPDSFYKASFEADAYATAEALLARRDELLLAGWTFPEPTPEMPERLRVLSELEALFTQHPSLFTEFSAGFADRIEQIIKILPVCNVPLEEVKLYDPVDLLPAHWRRLLDALVAKGVRVLPQVEEKQVVDGEDSDLTVFKKFIEKQIPNGKDKFRGDGSLLLMVASRETIGAEFLAKIFGANPDWRPLCLIPEKNRALDNALIHEGLPSLGIQSASLARPTLQILKLVSAFLWNPVNPYKLLEFVSLPEKPLDAELSAVIASEISQRPGIQGEYWGRSVGRFLKEMADNSKGDKEKTAKAKQVKKDYDFWFERRRYAAGQPAPRKEVSDIFEYVADWAQKINSEGGNKQGRASLNVLREQAVRMVQLLGALPPDQTHISPLGLERLVRTVYEASPVVFFPEEEGRLDYVYQPGAILSASEEVLWWNFTRSDPDPGFARWYPVEMEVLKAAGANPDTPKQENRRLLWMRKRPVHLAQKRLLMVLPASVDGRQVQPHPLLGDLEACFGKDNLSKIALNVEQDDAPALFTKILPIPQRILLTAHALGRPKPYIYMPRPEKLAEREQESYSSLDTLLYYPYQWVFRHKIELRKSSILSVVKDNTLMGNLAHRLFQQLFNTPHYPTAKAALEKWIDREVQPLLEREGSVLLLYGREPERVSFVQTVKQAAWSLVSAIRDNGWEVEGVEMPLEGSFMGTKLVGTADLVLKNTAGERAIVDLKWSGAYYKDRITNEEDLQLVLYSKLLGAGDSWAHTAYFIIDRGRFFARNNHAFKEAQVVRSDSDHASVHTRIWRRMEKTYAWRLRQLNSGQIEVRTEATAPLLEELSAAELLDLLEMKSQDARWDDYRVLINLVE